MAKRSPSPLIKCPVCSLEVHSRGLHAHIRQKHNSSVGALSESRPTLKPESVKKRLKSKKKGNNEDFAAALGLLVYIVGRLWKQHKEQEAFKKTLSERINSKNRTASQRY